MAKKKKPNADRPRVSKTKKVPASRITAHVIADAIIEFCNRHGDPVTNLKLQKLLYYSQAWHLARFGTPLFPERLVAWVNGPAQPEIYSNFTSFGHLPIDRGFGTWALPKKVASHIQDVMIAYGHLSAFDLERLACQEDPWKKARGGREPDAPSDTPISMDAMRAFYKSRLNEQKKR